MQNMEPINPFASIYRKLAEIEKLVLEIKNQSNTKPEKNIESRLTRKEVCDRYKISLGTLHKLMKSGELSFEKVGRKTLFDGNAVENYFKSNEVNPP